MTNKTCRVCERDHHSVKRRTDGRVVCSACWRDSKAYRSHWMVRSLEFTPPQVSVHRARKPLEGQRELF